MMLLQSNEVANQKCEPNRFLQASQDQLVPLMSEAAFKGDVAMMERLVAKGASVNQHDQV